MYGTFDLTRFDELLRLGEISCSHCGGVLKPWGHASARVIRHLHGKKMFQPPRTRCTACKRTDVVISYDHVPRHRDALEVMASAILSSTQGKGHRKIAKELDRPTSTVRNWLGRFRANAENIRVFGTRMTARFGLVDELAPTGNAVGDALTALSAIARSYILRFAMAWRSPWELMNWMTQGVAFRLSADALSLPELGPDRKKPIAPIFRSTG